MRASVRLWRAVHWLRYRRLRRLARRSADSFSVEVLAVRRPTGVSRLFLAERIVIPSVSGASPAVAVVFFRGQDRQNLEPTRQVSIQGSRDGTGPVVVNIDGRPAVLGLGRAFDPARPTLADRLRSLGRFVVDLPHVLAVAIRAVFEGLARGIPTLLRWIARTVVRAARWTKGFVAGAPRVMWIVVSSLPVLVARALRWIGRQAWEQAQAAMAVLAAAIRAVPRLLRAATRVARRIGAFAVRTVMAAPAAAGRFARFVVRVIRWTGTVLGWVLKVIGNGIRSTLKALAAAIRAVPRLLRAATRLAQGIGAFAVRTVMAAPAAAARLARLGARLIRDALRCSSQLCVMVLRQVARIPGMAATALRRLAPVAAYLGPPAALLTAAVLPFVTSVAVPDGNFVIRTLLDLEIISAVGAAAWLTLRVGRYEQLRRLESMTEADRISVMWSQAARGMARLFRSGAVAVRGAPGGPIVVLELLPGFRHRLPAPGTETLLRRPPYRLEGAAALGTEIPLLVGRARTFGPYRLDQAEALRHVQRVSQRRLIGPASSLLVGGAAVTLSGWGLGNLSGAAAWSSPFAILGGMWLTLRLAERRDFNQLVRRGCDTNGATVAGLVGHPGWRGSFRPDELWLQMRGAEAGYLRVSVVGGQNPAALAVGEAVNIYLRDGSFKNVVVVVGSSANATVAGRYAAWSPEQTVATEDSVIAAR